jgi:hypothetical protein
MTDQPGLTCRHALRASAFAIGLALPLATSSVAKAQTAQGSSAITNLWQSAASAVGKQAGSAAAGWAMSAIGISTSTGQALADLAQIIDLLEQIEAELNAIEIDFEDLKCETAQDSQALTNALTAIGGLYDRYTDYVTNFDEAQSIPSWEGSLGVQTWLDEIFDPASGVQAQLIAMQHALIQPGGTGVISECVEFIVTQYQQGDGHKRAVFDWTGNDQAPGVYDVVQQLTDYYYLYQTWAAILLVEAYHVQACLDLQGSTFGDDRNCTFGGTSQVTPQDDVTSDTAPNLCADPANSQIAGLCLSAQKALTNANNNGAYDGLRAQLIAAGAPYSNALLGKVMAPGGLSHSDLIYPKSLEDFTSSATLNGEKIQFVPCDGMLTSANTCGFTVGPWNQPLFNGTTYGVITDESGKVLFGGYSHWKYGNNKFEGDNLSTMLENYFNRTAGNTGGTLGDWMKSIGFIDNQDPTKGPVGSPYNKIVLTGEDHNFGSHGEAVCMIDTNIKRSDSAQPWCDDNQGISHGALLTVTESGSGQVEASFTKQSASPEFYIAEFFNLEWKVAPGWLVGVQKNGEYWHFHWPSMAIQDMSPSWCTVRSKGTAPKDNRNAGGVPTMCGTDLEVWLDLVLPKPAVTTATASADATLYRADPTSNDGAGAELRLTGTSKHSSRKAGFGRGKRGANRLVVAFDAEKVQGFLDQGPIGSVRLVLSPAGDEDRSGGHFRRRHVPLVAAYPLSEDFEEGNGDVAAGDPGAGAGATWSCAVDAEIGNEVPDCLLDWTERRRFGGPRHERPALSSKEDLGPLVLEVGDHVASGVSAWLIELFDRRPRRGSLAYVSSEGADALGDLDLAPSLILTQDLAGEQAIAADAAE